MIGRTLNWLFDFLHSLRFRRNEAPKLSPEQLEEIAATEARRKFALDEATWSPLERLLYWWGNDAQSGETEDALQALEKRYAIRLPDDFRAYLIATMPKGNDWDSEGTTWWALSDLKSVREECADWEAGTGIDGDDKVIVFADYLIWCFAWAVDCSESEARGKVILINGDKNPSVGESFDDFLDRYVRDHYSVM